MDFTQIKHIKVNVQYKHIVAQWLCPSKLFALLLLCCCLNACTYIKYTLVQANYARIQNANPSQVNVKHMLDRGTFFIFGKPISTSSRFDKTAMAIAAYSNKFKENERADTMFFSGSDTHFGLNLPEGEFRLLVYADINKNQLFENNEIVGTHVIELDATTTPSKVMGHVDIPLVDTRHIPWAETFHSSNNAYSASLYYPSGTIRRLDDPIFDDGIATLGMYDPAAFMKHAQTLFYALEEDIPYKIPIVFVHGIGGSAKQFSTIIEQLDSAKYKPWFFYYPSGGDLDQLADFFYKIFLSGKVIPLGEMPMIVVAHSMGGLIVREALNHYQNKEKENKVHLFVTLASPLGGHPAAAMGEKKGFIVLPAWRDLNPQNRFIQSLHRKPLPSFLNYQLFYAYKNEQTIKFGQNSDGVVPLSSQLTPMAQEQSQQQFGFNTSHSGILQNQLAINLLVEKIDGVKNLFPDEHLAIFAKGGFDIELVGEPPRIQHTFRTMGKYVVAIANGELSPPTPGLTQFYEAVNGIKPASTKLEKAYLRFKKAFPEFAQAEKSNHLHGQE